MMIGRFGLLLLLLLLCFETVNFTGFSWQRFQWVGTDEIITSALRYDYPGIYSNMANLAKDYSAFKPEVSYWNDWTGKAGSMFWNKFFGLTDYQVRLPDAVVIVDASGIARFSRPCGDDWLCSPLIIPDVPKLGVVGTVQYGEPNYDIAKDYTVQWVKGSKGSVFISGHCFSAFSTSAHPTLEISAPGRHTVTFEGEYGYQLADVYLSKILSAADNYSTGGRMKIPEAEFLKSRDCNETARKAWPNVGGYWWKR